VTHFSVEYKEAKLVKLSQSGLSIAAFAKQEGINVSTMYSWRNRSNIPGGSVVNKQSADNWSAEEKFSIVLETSTLSEVELNEYCRQKGLYPEQVKDWKQACISGNAKPSNKKVTVETKTDKKRIKQLEKELARKEKALAETAALLVLRKKFDAYLDGKEED
jgi:transposase-like protein